MIRTLGPALAAAKTHAHHLSFGPAAVWVAFIAVVISIAAYESSRRGNKRTLLLDLHDRLTTVEQQGGRALLHELSKINNGSPSAEMVAAKTEKELELMNSAVGYLNTMTTYFKRRYVQRDPLLEQWAVTVVRVMPGAEAYMAYRDAQAGGGARIWPELRAFKNRAVRYVSDEGRQGEVGVVWPAVSVGAKTRSGKRRRSPARVARDWWQRM
jgi:hypothetical protein